MYSRSLNPPVFAFWLFLALCISAISTVIISQNDALDNAAMIVSGLTIVGALLSMALVFAEHVMEICSS